MAQLLEVHCRVCGLDDHQLDGPVFAGYQPRCDRCGETHLVAWDGSSGSAAPAGRSSEVIEAWVSDQAGTCSCGGRFSTTAPIRCLNCRSTDVGSIVVGVAD